MELRQYLIDTFKFNDLMNKRILEKIRMLPDKTESVRFFSHLINSQYKWMARITQDIKAQEMDWWSPLYDLDEIENKWNNSLLLWLNYLDLQSDVELLTEVIFTGFDGTAFATTPGDIALQLNYHSIHHHAQIQTIIRSQGLTPNFVDYIGTKYRKLN